MTHNDLTILEAREDVLDGPLFDSAQTKFILALSATATAVLSVALWAIFSTAHVVVLFR